MAYDEVTTQRFRDALGDMDGITEKRMMGGICFLLNGNMIGGADKPKDAAKFGQTAGGARFMFRLGKENQAAGDKMPGAIPMEMGGRKMRGFYFVEEDGCDDEALQNWVDLSVGFAAKLPPK